MEWKTWSLFGWISLTLCTSHLNCSKTEVRFYQLKISSMEVMCKCLFFIGSTFGDISICSKQIGSMKISRNYITTTQFHHLTYATALQSYYEFLLCISCNSSSSFVKGIVEWLYKPCAINCSASGFFWPEAFLIFALLFWNQIFIWASFKPNSALSCCLRLSVK